MDELKRGTILAWRDPPCVNADSVQSVQADAAGGMPGVLQPRRAFPDALTASQEGNALRPRQDLVISSCISYNTDPDYTLCGVYEATSGAARVIVKLFIDVVDWDAVDWDSTYYDQFTYTGCPELDAVHEVRSYRRMRALQGSIVPYSLGFYKVSCRGSFGRSGRTRSRSELESECLAIFQFTVEGNIYLGHVMEDVTVGTGLDDIEEQIRSDEPGGWGRDLRFPLPLLVSLHRTSGSADYQEQTELNPFNTNSYCIAAD